MKQNNLKLFTILLFICSTIGQEILLDNISLTKEEPIKSLKFSKPEWDENLDFAIYGWIDLSVEFWNYATVYRMSQQTQKVYGDNNMFDRVLTLQVIQTGSGGKDLDFTTYDTTTHNPYNQVSIKLSKQETEKPLFVYQGYSSKHSKLFVYVHVNEQKSYKVEIPNMTHSTSKFYEVHINPQSQFVGHVSCLKLASGESAYRENDFQEIMSKQCKSEIPPTPTPTPTPVTFNTQVQKGRYDLQKGLFFQYDSQELISSRQFAMHSWIQITNLSSNQHLMLFRMGMMDLLQNSDIIKNYYNAISLDVSTYTDSFFIMNYLNKKQNYFTFMDKKLESLLGQWIFVYYGFDLDNKRSFVYVQNANGNVVDQVAFTFETEITSFSKVTIIHGFNQKGYEGQLQNPSFAYGDGAYMESNFNKIMGEIPK